jgi:hypothetical protein
VEPRRNATLASFRDPAREQRVIDYYRCQQQITAEAIEYFGKLAKQATNHRAIYGIYYGYFLGVLPQTQGGHLELLRLLQSPHIDYFVAPYDYGNRLMGQDGRLRSLSAAFNLAGKAHIIEADTRTFLHGRNEYGRTANLTESVAAIRREFSTGLIEHTGYWYVDFGPESRGGWFDHPEIMAAIKELYGLAERTLATPRQSVAEVALVCDLDSAYTLSDGEGMLTAYKLIMDTVGELYRTGAPFDAILLPQLAQADLSRYKVLIFLNATAMSDRQAAQVQKLRESGKHALVFLWAPGYTGPDGVSAARVQEATGFAVEQTALRAPGRMLVTAADHPLIRALPAAEQCTIEPASATAVPGFGDVANWHNPRSPVFMEEHYQQFDLAPADGGVTWTLQTKDSWSDVHWQGELAVRDGLGFEVMASSRHPQLNLRAVIKDANLAEFVSPAVTLPAGEWKTLHLPLQAFTNAPWAQVRPERPALPLQGMKFVIDGLANAGPITVQMRNLSLLTGEVRTTPVRRFGEGMFGPLVTPVAEPGVQVLGHIEGREDGLLAVRGQGRALTLYCPVPFLPREVLNAVLREAGVHVYDPDPADVVRADSRFVAVHTAEGGPRRLAFPGPVTVHDALSGQRLGTGPALDLTLPPHSTTILEITNP